MSTELSFVQYVCDQIQEAGSITYRKMFGEYMVYVNDKPIVLVCDNTPYLKMKEAINDLMKSATTGFPYPGAKEHYVLDIDNSKWATNIVMLLEKNTPVPKPKHKKKENSR